MSKIKKMGVPIIVVSIIFAVYFCKLFYWQIFQGSYYKEVSVQNSSYSTLIEAPRGEILDVNGEVLAGTETIYNIVMNAITMDSDRNSAIYEFILLAREYEIEWIDTFPIEINEEGEYQFKEDMDSDISYLKSSLLSVQDYATAEQCMELLIERYDVEDYYSQDARDIISIRYNMTKTSFSMDDPYVIVENIDMDFLQIVSEAMDDDMAGIEIRVTTDRYYEDAEIASHTIGTIGLISSSQYSNYSISGETYSSSNISGYTYTDILGKSGIEYVYEDYLRGERGLLEITLEDGEYVYTVSEEAEAGDNVYLTIDSGLQEVINYSLAQNVEAATAEEAIAGAAVVLDIEDFGILASSSYPTYDLDLYHNDSTYYYSLIEDDTLPLFNRAFDGVFAPGSVFKPLVAIAGLEESIITEYSTVYCNGSYNYYSDYSLNCLGVHGDVSLDEAMADSCNCYFADTGRLLGIDTLEIYANLFSLGVKTGVEISESAGSMTNPESYELIHDTSWVSGVTLQAAIGQADDSFTPLQLATYVATIANDGVRYETHLLDKVMDSTNETVIYEYEPVIAEIIELSDETLELVQESMRSVVTYGTASYVFSDYEIEIAGKTGTAENSVGADNTLFVAYAPYDDPEIAIAIVIEYGELGGLSRAVAKDAFDYYFGFKTFEEIKAGYEETDE